MFDPSMEAQNTNILDKWILASTQSLLKFVNEEMDGMYILSAHDRRSQPNKTRIPSVHRRS